MEKAIPTNARDFDLVELVVTSEMMALWPSQLAKTTLGKLMLLTLIIVRCLHSTLLPVSTEGTKPRGRQSLYTSESSM
jgi:hypothetical protein